MLCVVGWASCWQNGAPKRVRAICVISKVYKQPITCHDRLLGKLGN
jgi:hypothetical protein